MYSQLAWEYYLLCKDQVIVTPVGIAGLSFSAIRDVMDIYNVSAEKRKPIFERLLVIYNTIQDIQRKPEEA